jgi:hypothetical protein
MRKFDTTDVRVAQDYPRGLDHVPVATAAGIGGWGNLRAMQKRRAHNTENGSQRTSYESISTFSGTGSSV